MTHLAQNPPVVTTRIRYMGNKHDLARDVAAVVAQQRTGSPLIDVFSGMCSIAAAVAPSERPVWSNDVQEYAALVGRCHLKSQVGPLRSPDLSRVLSSAFSANVKALRERFEADLRDEETALRGSAVEPLSQLIDAWTHTGNDPGLAAEASRLADAPDSFPYRMCTLSFAHGYFGLRQAIEIDSMRYAIDAALAQGDLGSEQANWALMALLQAASVCASTPGHFAQFLRPNDLKSAARIIRQRARSPWGLFLDAADNHNPFGAAAWRKNNEVLCDDALTLWPTLDAYGLEHAIVYADPPYGKDQYSRYYHVLETLVRYDYPTATGAGRYRPDRFTTPFSLKTKVVGAFERLFTAISDRGWSLVLSYPSNGLFHQATPDPLDDLLERYFGQVSKALNTPVSHSTLGARHGASHVSTAEMVWLAT
jgi:adenine-specific DNA-methyltransferase